MDSQYNIVRASGERLGPFTETEVRQRVASGDLGPGDRVEDAATGSLWEPAVFSAAPDISTAPPPKRTSPLVWILVGFGVLMIPCVLVFAAILFPVFSQAKQAARVAKTMNDLKVVGVALATYQSDYDDQFPPVMDSMSNAWRYLDSYAKTAMPVSNNPASPVILGNGKLAGTLALKLRVPNKTFVFFDSAPWPNNKRIVLFADFHVKSTPEADFKDGLHNNMTLR